MARKSIIKEKSYGFSLKIFHLYDLLISSKDFDVARQILKSGTSIGANVEEALGAQSDKEFVSKLSIAYREARESVYWLRLIRDSRRADILYVKELIEECESLVRIIVKIRLTMLKKIKNNL